MSKFNYSESEQQLIKVIKMNQDDSNQLLNCNNDISYQKATDNAVASSIDLLNSLGYDKIDIQKSSHNKNNIIRTTNWGNIVKEAENRYNGQIQLEDLFTAEELKSNEEYLIKLRKEFNNIHRLDAIDWTIPIGAGILSAIINIVLVGIPQRTKSGTSAGFLSDYIRGIFDKILPPEEMEKLANSSKSKVPFDAQDNRSTKIYVDGLSTYYHRLLSLAHDPILAFIVGILDVMNGTMTTIDKKGRIAIQVVDCVNYVDRTEINFFKAFAKVFAHLKTDVITSMGLPAPLMGLFNLFQFGSIGEADQTIAEIVQGMYYEGYDFIHFCSMSVPVMITEVIVRVAYGIKRKKEGHKHYIPIINSREKYPKLGTELFIANFIATAINAGFVYVTENPLAINYPQWIVFVKYSFSQLKWVIVKKPELQNKYVQGFIDDEWNDIYFELEQTWDLYF